MAVGSPLGPVTCLVPSSWNNNGDRYVRLPLQDKTHSWFVFIFNLIFPTYISALFLPLIQFEDPHPCHKFSESTPCMTT